MKKITLILSAALVLITLSGGAWAQNGQNTPEFQEKLKVAEQVVLLISIPDRISKVVTENITVARNRVVNQIAQKNPQLSASQVKRAIDLTDEAFEKATNQYVSKELPLIHKNLSLAYVEKFSLDELYLIYQYQASDVGRKTRQFVLNELPELLKPTMEGAQRTEAEIASALYRVQVQLVQEGIAVQ